MKKKLWKKLVTWFVVVCIVVAGGGAGYWWYNKDDKAAAAPAFQQARVTQGTITQSVSGSGAVAVSETEDAIVSEAGTIDAVNVKEGDEVKKGDVLATFEGEDNSLDLNKAKLTLEQQQMQLEQAQEKWKSLQVSGASEDDLDAAEMSIKSAQLNIEQTKLQIADDEEKAQAPDPIVAPIDGTVTVVDVKAGDQVQARLTAFTIVNYNKLEVTISADELDITKIKVGESANVSIEALSGQKITGKVTEIAKDGTSSNGVSTFPVIVTLDQTENVLPGMSADVNIVIQQKENALIVPVDAVESIGGRYFVRVPKGEGTSATGAAGSTTGSNAGSGKGSGTGASQGTDDASASGSAPQGGAASQSGTAQQGGAASQGGTAQQGGAASQGGTAPQGGATANGTTGRGQFGGGQAQGASGYSRSGGTARGQGALAAMNQASSDFDMQAITVGITTDSQVEVTSGLTAGQTVLIPIVVNTSSSQNQMTVRGIGGAGGFGGVGGFPAGGFSGGGAGFTRTSGGGTGGGRG